VPAPTIRVEKQYLVGMTDRLESGATTSMVPASRTRANGAGDGGRVAAVDGGGLVDK
jgi:hypothetical protein